jgi:hypothetical protein
VVSLLGGAMIYSLHRTRRLADEVEPPVTPRGSV